MSQTLFNILKDCLSYEGKFKPLRSELIKLSEHFEKVKKLLIEIDKYYSENNSYILQLEFTKDSEVKVLYNHVFDRELNKKLLKGSTIFIFERY
tara:strand:+ start:213 stop:494 length:282 start_codon:yes stop_codon:yes gene_type:complete